MAFFLKTIASLVAGSALGLLATWASVELGVTNIVTDGPWHTSLSAGNSVGDPYTRASVAVHGLLALNRSETIYYSASSDGDGHALSSNCRYQIRGRDPDARWWSITAYATDDFLIPNPAHRYSISKSSLQRDSNGGFVATVSVQRAPGNWIPLRAGAFSLGLRLYNPGLAVTGDPARATLPVITRLSCA